MKKRYQVFVSSTYHDLKAERQAAVEAILSMGHIPAGMELFATGDKSQMEVIRRWIDESDIFMLILGARYGSIEPESGLSYIELEYDYGVERGKPFFAIVLKEEGNLKGKSISENPNEVAYQQFRGKVLSKICDFFTNTGDLKGAILKALHKTIESHPELVGWVPANESEPDLKLINKQLSRQIDELSAINHSQTAQNFHLKDQLQKLLADRVDLRLELRNALGDLHEGVRNLIELIDRADKSKQAVAAAKGMFRSGMMKRWQSDVQRDKNEIFEITKSSPASDEKFLNLDEQSLESKIVEVHKLQNRVNSLRDRYASYLSGDDEARRQIAEDNRAAVSAKLRKF
jgi:hypothetical protein